jgi:hypothetical protein
MGIVGSKGTHFGRKEKARNGKEWKESTHNLTLISGVFNFFHRWSMH